MQIKILFILCLFFFNSVFAQQTSSLPMNPYLNGQWIGNGISYSSYRDSESPDQGDITSKENILEDLQLISQRWNLIRLYAAGAISEQILSVIAENKLPIKVLQGVWIAGNQTAAENQAQVESAIELANKYPEIIIAVNVGNEILVDWSAHKFEKVEQVLPYVRQVKKAIQQPVTVNDDYNFWNKPHAQTLADEVDFIGLHAYAFWNNKTLDESVEWTRWIFHDIQTRYPNKQIVLGESGWPTSRIYNDGSYEGGLIGNANEANQKTFFEQYNQWINEEKIVSFYFEAFDENWKGGWDGKNPSQKAEKHWGVYFSNRTPKAALK